MLQYVFRSNNRKQYLLPVFTTQITPEKQNTINEFMNSNIFSKNCKIEIIAHHRALLFP